MLISSNFFKRWYDKVNNYMVSKSGVKVKEKANFYHLLSVMINAGIPMVKALKSLVSQMQDSPRMATVVTDMAKTIEEGESLSVSMLQFSDIFGVLEEPRGFARFINAGYITDLTKEMYAENKKWMNSFFVKALENNEFHADNEYGVKPGIYGVPIDVTNIQMVYNI